MDDVDGSDDEGRNEAACDRHGAKDAKDAPERQSSPNAGYVEETGRGNQQLPIDSELRLEDFISPSPPDHLTPVRFPLCQHQTRPGCHY